MQFASKTKPAQKKVPVLVEELSDSSRGMPKGTAQPSPKISRRASTKSLERSELSPVKVNPSKKTTENSSASTARKLDVRRPVSPSDVENSSLHVSSRPSSSTATLTEPATSKVASTAQPSSSDDILAWSRRLDASRSPSTEPSLAQQIKVDEPLKQVRLYLP